MSPEPSSALPDPSPAAETSGPAASPTPDAIPYEQPAAPGHPVASGHEARRVAPLALAALGVVYGDIGTSPLYAFRESFHSAYGLSPTRPDVLGVLSLFFWSLTLVVLVKYLVFVTRANNQGEGGVLALLALVMSKGKTASLIVLAGLFGAALLYADGMLTPAISVVSSVEGIREIDGIGEAVDPYVVPIAIAILVGLFLVQRRGTAKVGAVFGPVVLLWFFALASAGAYWIGRHPEVLLALSPHYAVEFFLRRSTAGFWVLGSVVLCITGGEALYADMGHFGRKPIMLAWLFVAFPALLLNYFGQGALVLDDPSHIEAPFFGLFPPMLRIPMVVLATAATVIASQALISGAFSLTRQAIQLGYLPRLEIRHTSHEHEGQIYLPAVNWGLMLSCIAAVLVFRTSSNMAAAYGIAVTGTMVITTLLFYAVARRWWGTARAAAVCIVMAVIDLAFLGANLDKLTTGGWIPLMVAGLVLAVMTTWKTGRARVARFLAARSQPLDRFLDRLDEQPPLRVPGTAVFMTSSPTGTPPVLLHHFEHNKVLHEQVVLLSIVTESVPHTSAAERLQVEHLRDGFFRVTARYGFAESPKVTRILAACAEVGLRTTPSDTSYYLGREKLTATRARGMPLWRKALFLVLSRNARTATDFFDIPPNRVVEIGMQLEL
jgi:KUP system potassium uptake protein